MRNLKKFLALVLSLMMIMSLMVSVNAASFSDSASSKYVEAIDVLKALGVVKGYDGTTEFKPEKPITRAEVAAIIYRIATGDKDDKQVSIYKDYNKFSDVTSDDWFAGYVNYCANAELVKGVGGNRFNPRGNVTGYQALAMILRAIGYGEKGEFEGTGWEIRTASRAKNLGITDNINEVTLGEAAKREVVAEIMFRAIQVPMVQYTSLLEYTYVDPTGGVVGDLTDNTKWTHLMWEAFKVWAKGGIGYDGKYGRPAQEWVNKAGVRVFAIDIEATAIYHEEISECQLTKDINSDNSIPWRNITEFVNGARVINRAAVPTYNQAGDTIIGQGYTSDMLDATHTTVNTIGARGRTTEIYKLPNNQWVFVYIDNMLGQIVDKTDLTFDTAHHVMDAATLSIEMNVDNPGNPGIADTVIVYSNDKSNFALNVGDLVMMNTWGMREYVADGTNPQKATLNEIPVGAMQIHWEVMKEDGVTKDHDEYAYVRIDTSKTVNDAILASVPSTLDDYKVTAEDGYANSAWALSDPQAVTQRTVTVNATLPASNTYANAYDNRGGIQATEGTFMANHGYMAHLNDYTPYTTRLEGYGYAQGGDPTDPVDPYYPTVPEKWSVAMINETIGKSYTLALDPWNNVIGMTQADAIPSVGVILSYDTFRVGAGRYTIEAEMLMADGSKQTVQLIKDRDRVGNSYSYEYFGGVDAKLTDGRYACDTNNLLNVGSLVEIEPLIMNGQTVYVITDCDPAGVGANVDGSDAIEAGIIKDVATAGETMLVNDDTIFFVLEYDYRYNEGYGTNQGGQLAPTYSVVTGFKKIPTAKADSGELAFQVLGGVTTNDGKYVPYVVVEPKIVSSYNAADPSYTYEDSYVTTSKKTVAVDDSYLIIRPIATYADHSTYQAWRNGSEVTLTVANWNQDGMTNPVNKTIEEAMANNQLIYALSVNSRGWVTEVAVIDDVAEATPPVAETTVAVASTVDIYNDFDGNGSVEQAQSATIQAIRTVSYDAGVLTVDKGTGMETDDIRITVDTDVKVWIVNKDNGSVTPGTLDSIAQYNRYNRNTNGIDGHDFVFELNNLGYISTLYIVD